MTIILIVKHHRVIGYANTIKEAKEKVIAHFFKNSDYRPTTWEHACKISNINIVYSFQEVKKFGEEF